MERALVAAASIAAHLVARRQPIGLCTTGHDPLKSGPAALAGGRRGRAQLIQVLGTLGRLESAPQGAARADRAGRDHGSAGAARWC